MTRAREVEEVRLQEIRSLIGDPYHISASKVAYWIYLVVLFGSFFVYTFAQSAQQRHVDTATVGVVHRLAPALLTAAAAALLVFAARFGTWAGPVMLSRGDASWLLTAPLPRRAIIRPHLVGAAMLALVGGLLAGLVSAFSLTVYTRTSVAWQIAASIACYSLIAVCAIAVSWLVESHPAAPRRVLRSSPVLLLATIGVTVAAWSYPDVALWTGPWGWYAIPIMAAAGDRQPLWPAALALLVAATAGSAEAAWRRAARVHAEELQRRAGTRTGLIASIMLADFRTVALLRRDRVVTLSGIPRVNLPAPAHPKAIVIWRDGVSLLRARSRTIGAVIAAAGGAVLLSTWTRSWMATIAGALLVYAGAANVLEPMRIEIDDPTPSRLLPWSYRRTVLNHALLPVTVVVAVTTLVAASLHLVDASQPAAIALTASLALAIATSAIAAAVRGEPPIQMLALGEFGIAAFLSWVFLGPLIAITISMPIMLLARSATAETSSTTSSYSATALALAAALITFTLTSIKLRQQRNGPAVRDI